MSPNTRRHGATPDSVRATRPSVVRRSVALGAWTLLGVVCGCGDPGERFVPVAGKVMLNGKPLSGGAVSFRPDASRGNKSMHIPTGTIGAQGNYELVTVGKKGAPPGWYRVLVFADANTPPPGVPAHPIPPRWLTDVKYTDEQTTDLFLEVVEKPEPGAYDLNLR